MYSLAAYSLQDTATSAANARYRALAAEVASGLEDSPTLPVVAATTRFPVLGIAHLIPGPAPTTHWLRYRPDIACVGFLHNSGVLRHHALVVGQQLLPRFRVRFIAVSGSGPRISRS